MGIVDEREGIVLRGGLHLAASRLWLNGDTRLGVGFVAEHDGRRRARSRVLCTPIVANLLGLGHGAPLAVPCGRPFRLGRLAVELAPGGTSAGAAVLRFWHRDRVFVDLAAARLDTLPTADPLDLEPSDVALVDATYAATELSDVANLRARLLAGIAEVSPGVCAVCCAEPTVALDLLCLLDESGPIYANRALLTLADRSRAAGVVLPRLRRLDAVPPKSGIVLVAGAARPATLTGALAGVPRLLVAARFDAPALAAYGAQGGVAFARRASGVAVDAVVAASGAREVIAWGEGAGALCKRLRSTGLACWQLVEDAQLELV